MGRDRLAPRGAAWGLVCAAMLALSAGNALASHIGEELLLDQQAIDSSNQLLTVLKQYQRTPVGERAALAAQLVQLAKQRRDRMLALIDASPSTAVLRVLPPSARSRLPAEAQALVEQSVQIRGAVTAVVADDFQRGQSQTRLQMADDKGERYELRVAGASTREQAGWSGKRGAVSAVQLERHLLVVDKRQLQLLAADGTTGGTTLAAATGPIQGAQNTLVVMLNFNDKAAECTAADVQSRLFGASGATLDQGYRQSSGGLVSFTGKVIGPFNTSYSSTGTCDHNGWANAANAAALASGVNPSSYQRVSYVTPRNANCGWTGLGSLGGSQPTSTWVQQCTGTGVFSHELGHNLGFHHAATPGVEYGDASDPMGAAKLVQSNAPNRVMAGWLAGAQVQDVVTGGSFVVNALESEVSEARVLRLAKRDTAEYYYVSLRQPTGVDTNLWSTYQNTLSIHKSTGTLPAYTFLLATLAAGQTWTDSVNGIQITNQGVSGSAATVGVGLGGASCARLAPTLSTAPSSQSAAPGSTLSYTLSLTNNNSAACASSTFNLTQGLPSGFAGALGTASVSLAPGASTTVGWNVTAASTVGDAVYTLTAAANESTVTSGAEVHASYTVVSPTITPPPPPPPPPPAPPTDTAPPALAITSPANGSAISTRLVSLGATATDASGVATVEFYVDGKLIVSDASSPYTVNWNTRRAARGTHAIKVRAIDAFGNTAEQTILVTLN